MSIESSLQNPRSGCSLAALAVGLLAGAGILVGGIAMLSMIPGSWREMQEVWVEAPGTITSVRVKASTVRTGNQPKNYHSSEMYTVVADCRYSVEGKEYNGKDLPTPRQPSSSGNPEEAVSVATTYTPGESIPVYHHPTQIEKARLDASGPNGLFWLSVIFSPLLLLGGLGLAWWTWAEWRGKFRRTTAA